MNTRKTRVGLELLAVLAVAGCGRAEQGSEEVGRAAQELQSGPDFVITAVSAPASTTSGKNITVQVTVCNQGTVSDSTDLEVYLSADANIHANTSSAPSEDYLLGSGYVSSPLSPGQCATVPVSGSAYPPPPTGGTSPDSAYYVGAVADPRNSHAELREDNNTTVGDRMGLGSLPDFVITSVTGPTSATNGQNITAQVTVCNQGTQPGSSNVEVYLSADANIHANTSSAPSEDYFLGSGYTPSLSPGQCSTLPVSGSAYPPPPTGGTSPDSAYYLGAVVDPRNSQPELREDNNAAAGNRMGLGSLPDFVITSVTGPVSAAKGQSITAQVTVCNQGTQPGSSNVEVYLSADAAIHANTSSAPSEDYLLGSGYTPTLNPGQCVTQPVSGSAYPPSSTGGTSPDSAYYLGAVVDPRNSQSELREDNNTTVGPRVGVGSLPDFVITSVTGPASATSGQSITAQVTVCNQGTQPGSSNFEVYLSADANIHANTSSAPSEDYFLGSGYTPTLSPGQCVTQPVSGSAYPPPPPTGGSSSDSAYYLGAVVDPRNSQPELREDNNTTVGPRVGVGSLPDFVITSVTGPASATSGQSITAQVTVCNQGTQSASSNFEVYLSADANIHANTSSAPSEDYFLGSGYTPTLSPGQCVTQPVSGSAYPPPPTGGSSSDSAYYLGAVVDPRNSQPELREDNNTTAGPRVGVGSLPDFVITSVTGPISATSGQSITAQVTVCNQGTQPGSSNFEVYLSADANIHANTSSAPSEDYYLGSGYTPTLNPGQCVTQPVSGSAYPPPPTGGTSPDSAYYLGAVVDPRNSQSELREDNNTTVGPRVGVGNLPDFVITSVTGPVSATNGQSITAQVTVCNQGTQSASSNFEVYLSADANIHANTSSAPSEDYYLGSGYTPTLNPGQCVTQPVSGSAYPPPPTGGTSPDSAYYLGAVVDPRNSLPELREDNNTTVGPRVGVGSLPDFVITSVTGPASATNSQTITAQVTVCNQGTQPASSTVEAYLSADANIHANTSSAPSEDSFVGSVSTPTLSPGQCATLPVSGPAYPPPPTGGTSSDSAYYLGAVVDPRNSLPELREDNNTTVGPRVGVGSLPDFVVTSVTGPASAQLGQSLTAQVTVCNQGTQPGSSTVEVYLSADAAIHANTSSAPSEDSFVGSVSTPTLSPGQCATLPVSGSAYPPPPPSGTSAEGAYYLGAVVDPRNSLPELREDNNANAGARMGVGSKADFVITSVTGPSSVRMGSGFSATFTVCNRGQSTDSTDVELYFSSDTNIHANTSAGPSEDSFLGRVTGIYLAPGVCGTQTITVSAYVPTSGGYYLGAVADPMNSRPELIEDNNATAGSFISVTP